MNKENQKRKMVADLRKKAEKRLKSATMPIEKLSEKEVRILAHDLQVYQIELDMQNEELRKSQLELENIKNKYISLYDYAPVGYFTINENGLILEVNLAGSEMLGLERGLLIKKPFSKFITKVYQDKYYLYSKQVFKEENSRTCDLVMARNDGTQFYARIKSVIARDEDVTYRKCLTIMTDITEQRRADDEIKLALSKSREYKENLDAIFKSIRDGIIMVDRDLKILEFNDSARRICGFPGIDETRGKEFKLFAKKCKGECIEALIETANTKFPAERCRFECFSSDESKTLVSATTYPLFDNQKQFNGCVIVVRDETKLAALENCMQEHHKFYNIIGKNHKLQKVFSLIKTLADTPTTVLITGESGTGKTLVAEALHSYGKDSMKKPYVVISCSSLSDNILESELFGHVKGAYTGSISDRIGRFEMAEGGTIFLDEIGDISNAMQLRLLRVLEERVFERVGDSKTIKANVRVIAATNQDLRRKVMEGKFREDLYHRLNVVELVIPPLRERREDIPLLVEFFIDKLNLRLGKHIRILSTDVNKLFMEYGWPGNVRELYNTLEYAFTICKDSVITRDNLPLEFGKVRVGDRPRVEKTKINNRQQILQALEKTDWNKAKAARILGIHRVTIYKLMKKFSINEKERQ